MNAFSLPLGAAKVEVSATLFRGLDLPVCTFGPSFPLAGAVPDTGLLTTKDF